MRVEFMPGIAAISGAMKGKNGKRIVFTHHKSDKLGQGRMYLRDANAYQRSTPPSEKEQAARIRFQEISAQVNAMSVEEKQRYAQEMHDAKLLFNGKKYATLRGYIMARLYAEIGDSTKPA